MEERERKPGGRHIDIGEDIGKQIFAQIGNAIAQHQAAKDRDGLDANVLSKGAAHMAAEAAVSGDKSVQYLIITGVLYGDGKEITGMGTTCNMQGSRELFDAIMMKHVPGLCQDHLTFLGKLKVAMRILFQGKKINKMFVDPDDAQGVHKALAKLDKDKLKKIV